MFVKKDLRKIPQILADASGDDITSDKRLKELRLARRPAEFNGSASILCQPEYASALRDIISLSLYDCQISNISDLGFSASQVPIPNHREEVSDNNGDDNLGESGIVLSNLSRLDLGRNPLTTLPLELGLLHRSLTSLWLDDCDVSGSMPECIYDLTNLKILRLSNNNVTSIKGKGGFDKLKHLQVLCLDGNRIEEIPASLGDNLLNLESLLLRQNKLTALPEGFPGSKQSRLTLLHVSSNSLSKLPPSLSECQSLTTLYANGNKITTIPEGISGLSNLVNCNLSNNEISDIPKDFLERFGDPDIDTGKCSKDESCTIQLEQNPVLKLMQEPESMDVS